MPATARPWQQHREWIIGARNRPVCMVGQEIESPWEPEDEANMNLLLAAPAMLAMLKRIMSHTVWQEGPEYRPAWFAQAQELVAKAEGRWCPWCQNTGYYEIEGQIYKCESAIHGEAASG